MKNFIKVCLSLLVVVMVFTSCVQEEELVLNNCDLIEKKAIGLSLAFKNDLEKSKHYENFQRVEDGKMGLEVYEVNFRTLQTEVLEFDSYKELTNFIFKNKDSCSSIEKYFPPF